MIKTRLDSDVFTLLTDPVDGTAVEKSDDDFVYFRNGTAYPLYDGTPILFHEGDSLFSAKEIFENRPTTQDQAYRSKKVLKNYVRQNILPSLSKDSNVAARYRELAAKINGGIILIIGAGDKVNFYEECFPNSKIVMSDVHCQFGVDVVFDSHYIPFRDNAFDLVLAAQVLEHTARPWRVAAEMQRVCKPGGYMQIEVPFAFPYHGAPYDFYRFTPTALRFLFSKSELLKLTAPEGRWSGAAVALSEALINSFGKRIFRRMALATGRILFGWMKYLDKIAVRQDFVMPKGFAATYRYDGKSRNDKELMADTEKYAS
jgi:SAM-dependent methyltransferase